MQVKVGQGWTGVGCLWRAAALYHPTVSHYSSFVVENVLLEL